MRGVVIMMVGQQGGMGVGVREEGEWRWTRQEGGREGGKRFDDHVAGATGGKQRWKGMGNLRKVRQEEGAGKAMRKGDKGCDVQPFCTSLACAGWHGDRA